MFILDRTWQDAEYSKAWIWKNNMQMPQMQAHKSSFVQVNAIAWISKQKRPQPELKTIAFAARCKDCPIAPYNQQGQPHCPWWWKHTYATSVTLFRICRIYSAQLLRINLGGGVFNTKIKCLCWSMDLAITSTSLLTLLHSAPQPTAAELDRNASIFEPLRTGLGHSFLFHSSPDFCMRRLIWEAPFPLPPHFLSFFFSSSYKPESDSHIVP